MQKQNRVHEFMHAVENLSAFIVRVALSSARCS
jgi:hypothetical protein